jgi:hypothetical protein
MANRVSLSTQDSIQSLTIGFLVIYDQYLSIHGILEDKMSF